MDICTFIHDNSCNTPIYDEKTKINQKRSKIISMKATEEMKSELESRAKEAGQTLSTYILNRALENNPCSGMIIHRAEILENLEKLKNNADDEVIVVKTVEEIAKRMGGR
ncbi:MAG: hypothetical protein J1E62_09265 [Lachnospiraceae bacterium]|nr:hypothetical protein [Lachnospiraceae bacterium]